MKPKTIITVFLLLFVALSVVYLMVGERKGILETGTSPDGSNLTDPAPIETIPADNPFETSPIVSPSSDTSPAVTPPPDNSASSPEKTSPETYVAVYYFHGYYRCITCRTIEMYTRDAVNKAFLKELGDGSLHLRVLNMQDPANEAYVKDFSLEYNIVVLEKVVDGKRIEWKKLEGVWELLKDEAAFKKYVQNETRNYLKGIK